MRGIAKASTRTLAIIAVLTAAVWISPAAAEVITVWPDQVIPADANSFISFPTYVFTTNAGGLSYAPLVLPVGATITKLTLYRSASAGAARTLTHLVRMKMGQAHDILAVVDVTDANSAITAHSTASIFQPAVEAGYRYFLLFYTINTAGTGEIRGAKVRYNLP